MTSRLKNKIIAVCGKGGVGKTSVSAILTKIFVTGGNHRVLAIDADPAVGLASSLGITVKRTLDDIRTDLISQIKDSEPAHLPDLIKQLDYELFNAIEERENLVFLAIGRPEKAGCYCKINSFLKETIRELIPGFDYVIIDGEAGIEQVNRRVMNMVTHLLLVSDTSMKGINVALTIEKVARRAMAYQHLGLIINKVKPSDNLTHLQQALSLPILGHLPEDDNIRDFDHMGRSFFELHHSLMENHIRKILKDFI